MEKHRTFSRQRLLDTAANKRSLKKTKRDLAEYRHVIPCSKAPDGTRSSSRPELNSIVRDFYTNIFKTRRHLTAARLPLGGNVPTFLPSEVRHAIETMSKGKSPGADGITVEILQACGHKMFIALAQRFSRYVTSCEVPSAWKSSKTILLFKTGDREDLSKYRPITFLPVLYNKVKNNKY